MSAPKIGALVLALGSLLPVPIVAAQVAAAGGIAGEVKDTTGAVLPGVTVEAASAALIEKTRTVISDERGQYKIVDLRPGTYSVTFTLSGFSTVKREGIELTSGFTATVNAELRVGALEETITVSGGSPVVDTHNVRVQNLLGREVLDTLPTGKTYGGYVALTLGATLSSGGLPDVGGDQGEQYTTVVMHGTRANDGRLMFDGMTFNSSNATGSGPATHFKVNHLGVEEVGIEVSGKSAEAENGGAYTNVVPKSGGNTLNFALQGSFTNGDLQSDNLTDDLIARGLTIRSSLKELYDWGGAVGGPIKRDKVWFYTAHRWWGNQSTAPVSFANQTQGTPFYTPDTTQVGFTDFYQRDHSVRVTWQAHPKHRITAFESYQNNCFCHYFLGTQLRTTETAVDFPLRPLNMVQATWSYPATNRLLFEAGYTNLYDINTGLPQPGVLPSTIPITELSTGLIYNAYQSTGPGGGSYGKTIQSQSNTRFSMSYVSGSHAFKVGGTTLTGETSYPDYYINDPALSYTFLNGAPASLTQWASPGSAYQNVKLNLGLYAQDQWTIARWTLNLGIRFDHLNAFVPEQTRPPGRFVGAVNISRIDNVPNWTDVSPRLGVAYDLFGNGKTAVKASLNRYVNAHAAELASAVNPANALVLSATRTWNDVNGNYVPDCDFNNLGAGPECGAISNRAFGTVVTNTRYATEVLEGFGARDYTWQAAVSAQHELRPNVAINVGYFRYWFGNFFVTDNLLVTPSDYSGFCVTAPVDARLPGGGGDELCELYDVIPAKFGQVSNLVTQASNFGEQIEVTNAVDVALSARFGRGANVSGGISTAQTVTDNCYAIDSPQQQRPGFCRIAPPWSGQTQFKLNGSYPLPWDSQVSAVYQNTAGIPILANRAYTNAEVAPSLGRNLSNCPPASTVCNATVTVPLMFTGQMYEERLSQFDLRFTKNIRLDRARIRGTFDLYNLFNANTIVSRNNTYGSSWGRPNAILGGRLIKFGVQVDY